MATPRREIVDPLNSGIYHCISNCVRGAILGDSARKKTRRQRDILERMRQLVDVFAIDGLGFAILSSHFHLLLRTHPEQAEKWSAHEVVRRWSVIHPSSVMSWALPIAQADIGFRYRFDRDANRHLELDEAVQLVARGRLSSR